MRVLFLGVGNSTTRRMIPPGGPDELPLLTVVEGVDLNPSPVVTLEWDLENTPWPLPSDTYDEIHAYEVMEHLSLQGDWRGFFRIWAEVDRILKVGGHFLGTSPLWSSPWAWGDPGHTTIISSEKLVFLSQRQYADQVGHTPMTDYREVWKGNLERVQEEVVGTTFCYCLRKEPR